MNNTTCGATRQSQSQIEFDSFVHLAQTAERGQARLLLPRRGPAPARAAGPDPRPRRRRPPRHARRADRARRGHRPPRARRHAQRHVPRAVRAGPPAGHARPPVRRPGRRGTWSRRRTRSPARTSAAAASSTTPIATSGPASSSAHARELWDSWARRRDRRRPGQRAVRAPRPAGRVRPPRRAVRHPRPLHVPRSPQGHPVILQAGDSDGGRELAAPDADAHLQPALPPRRRRRRSTTTSRRAWPSTAASPTTSRSCPAATFVLGDTADEAGEQAHAIRRQQVSPQTAILLLEQVWNRDLSAYDAEGPLPDDRPRRVGAVDHPGSGPDARRPAGDGREVAGAGRAASNLSASAT